MRVEDFIQRFTINPEKDIVHSFKLTKQLDIDAGDHNGCFNCGNRITVMRLKSSSWTGVQYCYSCNHLNVIHYSDRMSGVHTDIVKCFTDK